MRAENAALTLDFFNRLSPEARYFRFMERIQGLPPTLVARFTQVDYDREMALVALVPEPEGLAQIGAARYSLTADGESVEFALVVDDRWQRSGLGRRLMASLGFSILPHPDGADMRRVVKPLQD